MLHSKVLQWKKKKSEVESGDKRCIMNKRIRLGQMMWHGRANLSVMVVPTSHSTL